MADEQKVAEKNRQAEINKQFPPEFPKNLYHPSMGIRAVGNEYEQKNLGPGWYNTQEEARLASVAADNEKARTAAPKEAKVGDQPKPKAVPAKPAAKPASAPAKKK